MLRRTIDAVLLFALTCSSLLSGSALVFFLFNAAAEGSPVLEPSVPEDITLAVWEFEAANPNRTVDGGVHVLERRHTYGCYAGHLDTLTNKESVALAKGLRSGDIPHWGFYPGVRTVYVQSFKWEDPEACLDHCRNCMVYAAIKKYDAMSCYVYANDLSLSACKTGYTAKPAAIPGFCDDPIYFGIASLTCDVVGTNLDVDLQNAAGEAPSWPDFISPDGVNIISPGE